MLFWITLIAAVVFGILGHLCINSQKYNLDILGGISLGISIFTAIVACGMLIAIGVVHIDALREEAKLQVTYESLTYQLENDLYDNDNDFGKKELYDQITKYNQDVFTGKRMQRNFWSGVFTPNIYDNLELIELKGR